MPVRERRRRVDPACEFEKDSNRRDRSGQHLEERMGGLWRYQEEDEQQRS
jgi:hypothetical protein